MPAPHWFYLILLLAAAGCGRMGVRLYRLDADAGWQPRDAGPLPAAGRAGGESGSGAAADSGIDSGPGYRGDASTSKPLDAGSPTDAGNPVSCGGALQLDLCWYLAAEDTSCSSECANKGGFDNRALDYVGTPSQGGSEAYCEQVLTALGRPGTVAVGTQQIGLGCHLWNNGDRWWLQSPNFTANAASPQGTGVRITCACKD